MTSPIPSHEFGGDGPLIHFAHANAYPPGSYRQMIEYLLPRFRVTGICHRPLWPDSHPQELDSWHLIGDDMIRFLDEQGVRGVIGMGHSLGGVATMYAALKRPDLFSKLILIEPVFYTPAALKAISLNRALAEQTPLVKSARRRRNKWGNREAAFTNFRQKSVFERWPDSTLWDYVNSGLRQDGTGEYVLAYPREWEARIYTTIPTDVWDHIPKLAHSTLALRGQLSDTLLSENWRLWQELQPGATFVEMDEAGHMLLMEQPEATASVVLDFLSAAAEV